MPGGRSIRIIVNPIAGGGRRMRHLPALLADVRRRGVAAEVVETRGRGHACELAEQAAVEQCGVVAVFGGDGTVNEVANALLRAPAPPVLAALHGGSVNAIARFLGVPRSLSGQAQMLAETNEAAIDVGWAKFDAEAGRTERAFLLLGGAGWNATLIERASSYRRLGSAATYAVAGLREWWRVGSTRAHVTLGDDSRTVMLTDLLVVNGPVNGTLLQLAPAADPTDGLLEAIVVTGAGRLRLMELTARLVNGSHLTHPYTWYRRVSNVGVGACVTVPVQVDGEFVGWAPATFRVQRSALRVLLPRGVGLANPRAAVHSDNYDDLLPPEAKKESLQRA